MLLRAAGGGYLSAAKFYRWRVAVYMGSPSLRLGPTGAAPSNSPAMPPSEPKCLVPPIPPAKLADAPFDNAGADVVLQSSDKVHFHVFKNILSIASPVFADMFTLPSLPSEKLHEVQVVSLTEHSTALDVALRHIYPVRTPKGDKLHHASILSEFARKYQVETLDEFITGCLTDSIKRDPVGVYAIAGTYGYNDIGAIAARSCLNLPFSSLQSPYLRCMTAEQLSELHMYHVACGKAASTAALGIKPGIPIPIGSLTFEGAFGPSCQSCSLQNFINYTSTIPSEP
jgi:BTB/POZ domain